MKETVPVFNSLGSNYRFSLGLKALQLRLSAGQAQLERLFTILETDHNGRPILTYKGRDAITLAIKAATQHAQTGKKVGSKPDFEPVVLTQAFSCHAIEAGIVRAGAQPLFVDIDPKTINPSLKTLNAAWKKWQQAQTDRKKAGLLPQRPVALVIQHTLGLPAPMPEIVKWCRSKEILLIEDLASAYAGQTIEGGDLGSFGDMVVLSFGRDKIWDAVSGGALILRSKPLLKQAASLRRQLAQVPGRMLWRDAWYPMLTWWIRATHQFVVGKALFIIGRRLGWLRSPIESPLTGPAALPPAFAGLALEQRQHFKSVLDHRQAIAAIYQDQLPAEIQVGTDAQRQHSSQVRFLIRVSDPDGLGRRLSNQGWYLTDRWYRQPVDFGKLNYTTTYQSGSCPEAERLATQIFNLPTHQAISTQQARDLVRYINTGCREFLGPVS